MLYISTTDQTQCHLSWRNPQSLAQLGRDIYPIVIISAYNIALKESLEIINKISILIDVSSDEEMLSLVKMSIGTKFITHTGPTSCAVLFFKLSTHAQEVKEE
ncbi:hypothetical protein J3R83DRAFT_8856 [Lanmaoa asiatica]|nr:hypothetical protein J3R83DRAFT_8856 [Lanmaoa asiatica]